MRVAVTGASGGLGRCVVTDVLAAGHEARAIDRVLPDEQRCPFITADIRDLGQMCGALSGCDAMAHLAAIPSPGGHTPEELFSVNALGTFNVLEAARLLGIRRVVTISSAAVLGHAFAQRQPVPLHDFPIDEKHDLAPEDVYGLSNWVRPRITSSLFAPYYASSEAKFDYFILRRALSWLARRCARHFTAILAGPPSACASLSCGTAARSPIG